MHAKTILQNWRSALLAAILGQIMVAAIAAPAEPTPPIKPVQHEWVVKDF